MEQTANVPVTISAEAAEYLAELGMHRELDEMLEHTRQTIPGLRAINVIYQPAYDMEFECILIEPTLDPDLEDWEAIRAWGVWRLTTFPPEVFNHFVLLPTY